MLRIIYLLSALFITSLAMGQYKAKLVDEQPFIQNSFVASGDGIFYLSGATSSGVFDIKFIKGGNIPTIVSSGYWDYGSQLHAGEGSLFFRASNGAIANPKAISPFLYRHGSGGSTVKLTAFDEAANVEIDAPVKVGSKLFYKVGTTLRKAQIWVTDVNSAATDTAYSIANVDVINAKGNSKYRMVEFKGELFSFITTNSTHFDVYKTTNLKFDSLTRITNFNNTVSDSLTIMVASQNKLFMFYKSGTADKLYAYDGDKLEYIGLTSGLLGVTDLATLGDTLYYTANKMVYQVVGKNINALPMPHGATTSINWIRTVGHKIAYIATDATYGKEPRLYDPNTNTVTVFDIAPGAATWNGVTYVVPINENDFVFYGKATTETKFYITSGNSMKTIDLEGEPIVSTGATPIVAGGYIYFSNIKTATRQLFAFNLAGIETSIGSAKTEQSAYFNADSKTIQFDNRMSKAHIVIYDISGRIVSDAHVAANNFDVSHLRKGIYIARINHQTIKFAVK